MNNDSLRQLLQDVQLGRFSPDEALEKLRWQPTEALGEFAQLDHHRILRQGMPEFIYGENKSPEQVADILAAMVDKTGMGLASRVGATHYSVVQAKLPQAVYHPVARLITVGGMPKSDKNQTLVIAAGTSDLPVSEEAAVVLRFLGHATQTLYDVGVAGIHRLLAHTRTLSAADVIIVVAGMEGALPSVVGGLISVPVIAVPTSIGYGASFGGLAALLGMLNSCATGLTVVNIDNGLGAACAAHRILMRLQVP